MKTSDSHLIMTACKWIAIAGMAAVLAACGGDSSSSSPGATQTSFLLSGTAATGAALGGATVTVTCASGTGTATANANGSYVVDVANGTGPCLLTVTSGGATLHSIAASSGVCNVTPLTDMLTSYLATQAGTTPANMLSSANGKAIIDDSPAITAAENSIATVLQNTYGVTLSTTNFLSATITPAGFGTQTQTDVDLDALSNAGVLTTTGAATATATSIIDTTASQQPPFVAPTGASS